MSHFDHMTADEIIRHLVTDGKISTEAVQLLERKLELDWVVTGDEAEMLFQINQHLGQLEENCPTWADLYVHAITQYLVFDMNTPGEVSTEEAEWLRKHIDASGKLSLNDVNLLKQIHKLAKVCCPTLHPLFDLAKV